VTPQPLKHSWIVHFSARAYPARNQQNVRTRAALKTVSRVDTQPSPRSYGFLFFRHRAYIERLQSLTSTGDGENLKWAAEVEHFDFFKDQNGNTALLILTVAPL
jgi:hypothetical protein